MMERANERARRLRRQIEAMHQTRAWRLATQVRSVRTRVRALRPDHGVRALVRAAKARRSESAEGVAADSTAPGSESSFSVARRVREERLTYLSEGRLRTLERFALAARAIPGDFVEAGVALGGSAIVLASQMPAERRFHGFDIFGMIPPTSDEDGKVANERYAVIASGDSQGIGGDIYYGYEDDLYEKVRAAFERFGIPVDGRRVFLHRGPFEETMRFDGPIALAHIDGDWYRSVKTALERIYPCLSPGGLCIIDDYHDWSGCKRAVDEFLADHADLRFVSDADSLVLARAGGDAASVV